MTESGLYKDQGKTKTETKTRPKRVHYKWGRDFNTTRKYHSNLWCLCEWRK